MIFKLTSGVLLVIFTVAIHSLVLTWCISRLHLDRAIEKGGFLTDTWLLSRMALWAVFAHLFEITLWGLFYTWQGIMPDVETGYYFSAVTYATIGYGDILPPPEWRLLASMEGLTGILMCAWSGGFFFAIVSRMYFPDKHHGAGR
ncbi:MAG: ion channel [Gammaproteobacteria bacterium]|nr:ion channel [Gammaproteobacteria bacterium]